MPRVPGRSRGLGSASSSLTHTGKLRSQFAGDETHGDAVKAPSREGRCGAPDHSVKAVSLDIKDLAHTQSGFEQKSDQDCRTKMPHPGF